MVSRHISKRLLYYRSALVHLEKMGFEYVYSKTIGEEIGVSPDVVRKDFSNIEIRGKRKVGYKVSDLIRKLDEMFGKTCCFEIIVVGMGNIGKALTKYEDYLSERIKILGGFDINPSRIKSFNEIPIMHFNEVEAFVAKNGIKVAVITVPEISAQLVCNKLIEAGIKGILNFAPVMLKVPDDVFVKNISIADEITRVFYHARIN
ncbi:MAG TPA: redox-sensing transcriptional repressor Rex [Salinivirga sp.]|uniref:redox-sensing transcriptional repressor Rex n=1 Tax=Salinivirga sp. TaxID=1970192 RepID=UPI002B4AA15B|nr:redox-sensing transcriptional repressor Rex [Salinivirga sp.]HKK58793.1 redox-sensing transcriptional repressor Rex [Salinivirga sp.]